MTIKVANEVSSIIFLIQLKLRKSIWLTQIFFMFYLYSRLLAYNNESLVDSLPEYKSAATSASF